MNRYFSLFSQITALGHIRCACLLPSMPKHDTGLVSECEKKARCKKFCVRPHAILVQLSLIGASSVCSCILYSQNIRRKRGRPYDYRTEVRESKRPALCSNSHSSHHARIGNRR